MDAKKAFKTATFFLVVGVLVGAVLWTRPVFAQESTSINEKIASEARLLIGTAPYAPDPSDCGQNPCSGYYVCTDVVAVATERAGVPIAEDSCACSLMRRAEYQRQYFMGDSVRGGNDALRRHYEAEGSAAPPAAGNILLYSAHVAVVVDVRSAGEGRLELWTVEANGGSARVNINSRKYELEKLGEGWYFISGRNHDSIFGWGVIDETEPLAPSSSASRWPYPVEQAPKSKGEWGWVGPAVAGLTIIALILFFFALVPPGSRMAAIKFMAKKAWKGFKWTMNKTLELWGKLMILLEPSEEEKRRFYWLQHGRGRGGCHYYFVGAFWGAILCSCVLVLMVIRLLVLGGMPLENLVGGRQTWVGRAVSRVSEIDPENVAYGLIPADEQKKWDQALLETSALPTFPITYWTGSEVSFHCPERIWSAAKAAASKHGCDPLLVVAIGHSEGPSYNQNAISRAGAKGTWQFMPGTWDLYWPPGPSQPGRENDSAGADAACRMELELELEEQTSELAFARRFNGADEGRCWNCADTDGGPEDPAVRQAKYAWKLWQQLLAETGGE